MKKQKIAAVICAVILGCTLILGVSAAADRNFGGAAGGLMREAESMIDDVMPGGETGSGMIGSDTAAESSGTLGDTSDVTSGDGVVEGTGDGFLGDESEMMAESTREPETETAATSSGEESRGISLMGVILTLIIIAAVAALLFALMPKRRNG
ncbi:MAG: hypothetical protein IJD06_00410 [Clostridia bacterium]|nr:hypothetical protein [Clostridia bacterium]